MFTRVNASAGHSVEIDEKSEQMRFGTVVRNVDKAHRSRTHGQAVPVRKGPGVAHRIRFDVKQNENELRIECRVLGGQHQQQREKVRKNLLPAPGNEGS